MNEHPTPFDPAQAGEYERLFLELQRAGNRLERHVRGRGYPVQVARDAAEIARDKWIDAIRSGLAAALPPAARFAWLRTVAGRDAATLCRRAAAVSLSDDESGIPPSLETGTGPRTRGLVLAAVESLPAELRLAVTLVDLDGKSEREAAGELRTSRRRVGRLRRRGHRALGTIFARLS